jgi:hypothetical protein
MTTPTEDLGIHNIDNFEQNYQPQKDYITKLYNETEQLADILNLGNGDPKFDIDLYDNTNYIWNIEDYFTI